MCEVHYEESILVYVKRAGGREIASTEKDPAPELEGLNPVAIQRCAEARSAQWRPAPAPRAPRRTRSRCPWSRLRPGSACRRGFPSQCPIPSPPSTGITAPVT